MNELIHQSGVKPFSFLKDVFTKQDTNQSLGKVKLNK